MKYPLIILLLLLFAGCDVKDKKTEIDKKRSHPSPIYSFVDIDTTNIKYFETDYLPVYSDIYLN